MIAVTRARLLFGQDATASLPILTVCEALRDLKTYNGRDVAIVGKAGFTFEGTVLSENCENDGRIPVQGERWLSAMMVLEGERASAFPFDEMRVRQKLDQVRQTTRLWPEEKGISKRSPLADRWTVMFGRLVSPKTLRPHRPPSQSQSKNIPGNGFGANGSVPAKLIVFATRELTLER
jgi:hypothetical protein